MEQQDLLSIIPNSLPLFVVLSVACRVRSSPPYYYLYQLPLLVKLVSLFSLLIPPPYNIVSSSLAIFLAWLGVAVYWVNLDNKSQVMQNCKKKVVNLVAGSFALAVFFFDDLSSIPWAEEVARIISILFAFFFLAVTFLPHSYPPLFMIFGAIVAAQPMQMTLHLTTALLKGYYDDAELEPILRFFWFLAAGFEGLLPLHAATHLTNEDIVWPKFKSSNLTHNHPQNTTPVYIKVMATADEECRPLLG